MANRSELHFNAEGRWLTGTGGASRLNALAATLAERTCSELNARIGGSFHDFAPWMCLKGLDLATTATLSASISGPIRYSITGAAADAIERMLHLPENGFPHSLVLERDSKKNRDFKMLVESALRIIVEFESSFRLRIDGLLHEILQIRPRTSDMSLREMGSGYSTHVYRSGIMLSLPVRFNNALEELAINLVHELGHQALIIYQYADPIIAEDPMTPVYSGVRKTHRPAVLSFHAAVALTYMVEFLNAARLHRLHGVDHSYLAHRLHEVKSDYASALNALDDVRLTPFGHLLFKEMKSILENSV